VGLIRTQSGVKLRLYVICRRGEEVCEKRGYRLIFFLFFSFFFVIMCYLFLGTKGLMQSEL